MALPTTDFDELQRLVVVGSRCQSLVEYLEAYRITLSVLQSERALERATFEAFELCAEDGVSYAEGRFCPALHTAKGLSLSAALAAVLRGTARASRVLAMRAGVIVCAMRDHSAEEAERLAELAVSLRGEGVVGFDIAGPEKGFPGAVFARAYRLAREGGLGCTAHAGEADGAHSVRTAIEVRFLFFFFFASDIWFCRISE